MTFIAEADRIYITDSNGNIKFDTRQRMLHVHSIINNKTLTCPQVPANKQLFTQEIHIAELEYPATFIFVSTLSGTLLNGTTVLNALTLNQSQNPLRAMRTLSFYVYNYDIYAKISAFNFSSQVLEPFIIRNLYFFAGNYDL